TTHPTPRPRAGRRLVGQPSCGGGSAVSAGAGATASRRGRGHTNRGLQLAADAGATRACTGVVGEGAGGLRERRFSLVTGQSQFALWQGASASACLPSIANARS